MPRPIRSRLPLLAFLPLLILLAIRAMAGDAPTPAVSAPPPAPPVPPATASLAVDDRLTIAAPLTQGLVTLYPVVDTKTPARPEGAYKLLRDGLADKTFTVEESDGGTVPALLVKNTGAKPVLLVAGDVVKGGKQDRVITSDVVVEPGQTADVAVNCVEHGRWSAGTTGHSFGYGGRGEGSLKKVVQVAKDQSATWSEVATSNGRKAALIRQKGDDAAADKLAPSTGTYIASLENEAVQDEVGPATSALIESLRGRAGVVGVVVAIGDSITTAELFGHPALFDRSREDLVRSFVLDGVGTDAKGTAPQASEAASFLRDALQASLVSSAEQGQAVKAERESDEAASFETTTKTGERIHFNAYAK